MENKSNIYNTQPTMDSSHTVESRRRFTITYNIVGEMPALQNWPTKIRRGETLTFSIPEYISVEGISNNVNYNESTRTCTVKDVLDNISVTIEVTTTCLKCIYNVTSTDNPTKLVGSLSRPDNNITKMIIDGVEMDVTPEYTFSSEGLNTVWFILADDHIKLECFRDYSSTYSSSLPINLTSVEIPKNITSIDKYAFCGCNSLANVTIPDTIEYIGENAFVGTSWHSAYILDESHLYNNLVYLYNLVYKAPTDIVDVTFREGTVGICGSAFSRCTQITSVTIPGSIEYIGEDAFYDCENITSVVISDGVKYIMDNAFSNCTKLLTATLPNSIVEIGLGAFWKCNTLSSVTCNAVIPPVLGESVFYKENSRGEEVKINNNIYVPSSSVTQYKNADRWSDYKSKISAIT